MGGTVIETESERLIRSGRASGTADGIISFALDLNYSNEEILAILQKKMNITETQADKYLEQYYDNNL